MFNVVSTCSYGYTVDTVSQEATLEKLKQKWKDEGKNADEVNFEAKNWKLLDGMRITKQDSFDFIIQTVGVFDNIELVQKACEILIDKLQYQDSLIEKDELVIEKSQNTMANSYDIILENEDYTIGKVLEYFMYTKFYETKILTFCGFKKMHPHDSQSIIRVAYREPIDISTIKGNLKECIDGASQVFAKVRKDFARMVKN
jgi:DNA-directed RNA polymerase subunit L